MIGLIPLIGLFCGPVAFVLGLWAWVGGREDPLQSGLGPAAAAMLLGGLVAVTNWVGVALMIYSLWSQWGS